MKPGDVVLAQLPQAGSSEKMLPALLICQFPPFVDWLVCGISSKLHRFQANFDEMLDSSAIDFTTSGLREPSVIRLGFLATLSARQIGGGLGSVQPVRLHRLRRNLSEYLGRVADV